MFSFKRKQQEVAMPDVVKEILDKERATECAQRCAMERKLQGMAIHGMMTKQCETGFVAEFGTTIGLCGCHMILVPTFGVLFWVDRDARTGWGDRCPHLQGAMLSPPPPSSILPPGDGVPLN